MADTDVVAVAEYATVLEAELAAGRLESAGIPSRIDQHGAVGIFGPGHVGSMLGVTLYVSRHRLEDAREALDFEDPD
jgi:hypothetical protein